MKKMIFLPVLSIALGACSSPPKPAVVDGSSRQTINDASTMELLALRARLAAAQTELREAQKQVNEARTDVLSARDQVRSTGLHGEIRTIPVPIPYSVPAASTTVFRYQFAFNSALWQPSESEKADLLPAAHAARQIAIRGRTDGNRPSPADEAIAKRRAVAARDVLIAAGISPQKMTINYVSAADYIADNYSPAGRALNRRVEIEILN